MGVGAALFNGLTDGLSFANLAAANGAAKMTLKYWIKPINNPFFGYFFGQVGGNGTGTGNVSGFGALQSGTDNTSLFDIFRNNDNSAEKSDTGLLSTAGFQPVWTVIDGTQGTVTNRLKTWINNSPITFGTDSNNFPTTIGTTDQPFTVGFAEISLANNFAIADFTIKFGVADTNATNISDHAAGKSGGNDLAAGDVWLSFLSNFDDVNRSITPTITGSPTIITGPSLTYPGGPLIVVPTFLLDQIENPWGVVDY